jgi:hypothetical protein
MAIGRGQKTVLPAGFSAAFPAASVMGRWTRKDSKNLRRER